MKDTEQNIGKMYARLDKVHGISYKSEDYYLDTKDYLFFTKLWTLCDHIKEWDKLVEKYKAVLEDSEIVGILQN